MRLPSTDLGSVQPLSVSLLQILIISRPPSYCAKQDADDYIFCQREKTRDEERRRGVAVERQHNREELKEEGKVRKKKKEITRLGLGYAEEQHILGHQNPADSNPKLHPAALSESFREGFVYKDHQNTAYLVQSK
jgi:hypothetical protein